MANLPPDSAALRLGDLCRIYLRAPQGVAVDSATGAPIILFEPPLTTQEQTVFTRIQNLSKSLVSGITADEWLALEPDIAGLVTYQGITSPTLAQTASAVKAQSRILRAILKN